MTRRVVSVPADSPLTEVAQRLDHRDLEQIPVTDDEGHLVGVVMRRDLLALVNRSLLQDSSLGIEFVHAGDDGLKRDYVQVPPSHRVEVVPVPAPWVGRSLRDLALRSHYGVNVVAVRRQGPRSVLERLVPDPDLPLTKGELLVVTGDDADLRRPSKEAHVGPLGS